MSPQDSVPTAPDAETSTSVKKRRSLWERAVVWTGIVALGGLLGYELFQKTAYDSTLSRVDKVLQDQAADGEKQTIGDIRKLISGSPREAQRGHARETLQCVELQWHSLFKDYRMILVMERKGDDPLVVAFTTPLNDDGDTDTDQAIVDVEPTTRLPTQPDLAIEAPAGRGSSALDKLLVGRQPRVRGMVAMAKLNDVAKELQLTGEQRSSIGALQTKIHQELEKQVIARNSDAAEALRVKSEESLRQLLDAAQFERLKQLLWREIGLAALEREDAIAALGVSDEQQRTLRDLLSERRESFQSDLREAPPDVVGRWHTKWDDRLRAALTDEQLAKWNDLVGKPGDVIDAANGGDAPAESNPKLAP